MKGDKNRLLTTFQSVHCGVKEKSIMEEPREHTTAIHPTQKPIKLLCRLLNLTTTEGDTILDPFSGSGATAIACINSNRKYIGFEIDKEYYTASIERINNFNQQLKLI